MTPLPDFGVVVDRYELLEIVGSGGMGVVYRGRDRVLGRTVAVKMIRRELVGEEFVRRFEREAAILARLRSPHIVVVYDYGQHEDQFFLVTDFLPDGDLAGWLDHNGPMPPRRAVALLARLAEGLADAHGHGVIHRDLKPANTLLYTRGGELQPVLGDFGIAIDGDVRLTATGGIVGSPVYMAPERHLGEPATEASDLYAMGCLLHAVLVGHPPFWDPAAPPVNAFQVANAHLTAPIPTLPSDLEGHDRLERLLARCLAKEPTDRISSATALASELDAIDRALRPHESDGSVSHEPTGDGDPDPQARRVVRGGASETVPVLPPAPPSPAADDDAAHRRRSRPRVAIMGLLSLAVVGGGTWVAISRGGDGPVGTDRSDSSQNSAAPLADAPGPPGPIDVRAVPGYRSVYVRADLPAVADGVRYHMESRKSGVWRPVGRSLTLPTTQGGEEACTDVRLTAVSDGGSTPGPSREVCGRASPRVVEVLPVDAACSYDPPVGPCTWVNLSFQGFESGVVARFTAFGDGVEAATPIDISIGDDGRFLLDGGTVDGAYQPGGVRFSDQVSTIVLRYDGQSWRFESSAYSRPG